MTKDIDQELDAIFAHHKARVAQARSDTVKTATHEDFSQAAATCLTTIIGPALDQMARALKERGVAARVTIDDHHARIDIPVSSHVRLGHGHGGYPYLRARPDRQTRRIYFERNTADSHGANALRDCAIPEINAEIVEAMVVDLVRVLFGPF